MSKGMTEKYKLLDSIGRRELRDDDIQDFAENTMNELLAWYGYGDKGLGNVDGTRRGQTRSNNESEQTTRHRIQFPSSPAPEVSDVTTAVLDPHRQVTESSQVEMGSHRRSASINSQRSKTQMTKETSSHSVDSTQSFHLKHHHRRPASVSSLASMDSMDSAILSNAKLQNKEPEYLLNSRLQAMTKVDKLCDWCKQVAPNVNLIDSVDGLNHLSFCSEMCLNHYKMNLFCTETRQYLQQIQNSEDGSNVAVGASDNKILITPDLWMAENKECKRRRCNENRIEMKTDDNCFRIDSEQDDDLCRQSECGSSYIDTSNGLDMAECLVQKKMKRKKEEKMLISSEISNETSSDGMKFQARFSPHDVSDSRTIPNIEDKSSDNENSSSRRGKRLKISTSKESASSAVYLGSANSLKSCHDNTDSLSVAGKDMTKHTRPDSRNRTRAGHVKLDAFPPGAQHHVNPSDILNNHIHQLSDAASLMERLKSDFVMGSCHGSRQTPTNTPQFTTSPAFGSSASLLGSSLFSQPGMPSLIHLLGPSLNAQFLGSGASNPPFPYVGFPPLFSNPGAAGGGVQVPPGIPVPPPPPPVTNPWSNLLPPSTLMIPYPVLLPLPIPIPIPIPLPLKNNQGMMGTEEQQQRKNRDNSVISNDNSQNENVMTDLRASVERQVDTRIVPNPHQQRRLHDKAETFPCHTIVCNCCRKDSEVFGQQDLHSRTTFCSPSLSDAEVHHSGKFTDGSNSLLVQSNQNLAIDFSMGKESKGNANNNLQSPDLQGSGSAKDVTSTVIIKTEPQDLVISSENNNLLSSSSSSSSSSSGIKPPSCDLLNLPSLPYLARRSLILDAPSISKEKPLHAEKHFNDSSSKKFMYCKRRYPSIHIKSK